MVGYKNCPLIGKFALPTKGLKGNAMTYNLINITAIVLLSMSTVGCSVARLAQMEKTVNIKTRQTQLSRKDFQLEFNTTGNQLNVQLRYLPHYKVEEQDIVKYRSQFTGWDTAIGLTSILAYTIFLVMPVEGDTYFVQDDPYSIGEGVLTANTTPRFGGGESTVAKDWNRMESWEKAVLIGIPADWMLSWFLPVNRTSHKRWKPTGREIAGKWQGLKDHPYHIELPTYNFSKEYRTKTGDESIAIREFMSGVKNSAPFLEIDTLALRASTTVDGKQYEKPLAITARAGLQPFYDAAHATLFDTESVGRPDLMPRAEATSEWKKGTVQAGQTATLEVTVRNTGKGELYRVIARTVSSDPTFNKRELQFGKIAPGESKTLPFSFETDKLMRTRDISLRLRFSEYNDYVPDDIEAKLHVIGRPRPKFDYAYRVVDGGTDFSVGNEDGILQRGESVDILVTVHNNGLGTAAEVTARLSLRRAIGVTQYGDSMVGLGAIAPGASKTATFNIGVKPKSSAKALTLNLAVTEADFGSETTLNDQITLLIGEKTTSRIAVLDVDATITAESAALQSGADSSTPTLAEIPKNARVHISGQLGGWYRVELGELAGWVQAGELTTRMVAAKPQLGSQSSTPQIVRVYQKMAPIVTLVEPGKPQVEVEGRTLSLTATAVDDKGIARIELTVNGKVVDMARRGMRASARKKRTIKETVPLIYGNNTIRLVVYDTDEQASQPLVISAHRSREQPRQDYALLFATDTYAAWEPLKNPIFDAKTIGTELENRYGFRVELVHNPTGRQIFAKLREYAQKRYNADDQLLIFFAGHGHFDEVDDAGYLIASDSMSATEDPDMISSIPHLRLHQRIDNIPCEHIFLIIDACFSGTFDGRVAQRGDVEPPVYEDVDRDKFMKDTLAIKTRLYLTSGGKEYVRDGRPGRHSPFARKVLEALRSNGGKDGILTLNEIEGFVEKTEPRPQPGEFGDNAPGSDFLFIRK